MSTIFEKREQLIEISNAAKAEARNKGLDPDNYTVNSLILRFIYNANKDKEFNSFISWKKAGRSVKKGEKGWLLWGQPLKNKTVNETTGEVVEVENLEGPDYYPIAYIFERSQTEPMETKEERADRKKKRRQAREAKAEPTAPAPQAEPQPIDNLFADYPTAPERKQSFELTPDFQAFSL